MSESFHLLVTTTLPDDVVWDENDELVQAGGHGVLTTITKQLQALGFKVYEPFMHHYSWETVMSRDGKRFSVLIQCWEGGPWLFTSGPSPGLLPNGKRLEKSRWNWNLGSGIIHFSQKLSLDSIPKGHLRRT